MRVLILADESFAARERSMLLRLEVGLADEGVRVIHAVPKSAAHWYHAELFSQAVTYENHGLIVSRSWRAAQLAAAVEALGDSEGRPADLVHVFGPEAWAIGADTARQLGAALAIEVYSGEQAEAALRLRPPTDGVAPIFFVPDQALERKLRAEDPGTPVRLTPWGVHTPTLTRRPLATGKAPSVLIAGSGAEQASIVSVLEGIAAVAPRVPDLMVFLEADGSRAASIWGMVRKLSLSDRVTLIPDLEARRELALRGDILILPEARGEHRSLTLDAMAATMVVIAAADPLVSVLVDHRTARLVNRPSPEHWSATLSWVFDEPLAAEALASAAREHVRTACRASAHVAAVVDAYEWMTSAESIPFPPAP